MRIPLFAALVAATALIPAAANAQDRHDHGDRNGGEQHSDSHADRGGDHANRGGDHANRGGGQNAAQSRPAARPAAAGLAGRPQFQAPDRHDAGAGNARGRFDGRSGDARPNPAIARPDAAGNTWHAQAGGQHGNRGDYRGGNQGRDDHGGQWNRGGNQGRDGHDGQWNRDGNQNRDGHNGQWNRGGQDGRGYGRDNGGYGNHQSFNRNWHSDRRYDWRGYRSHNRNAYHLPRYYSPRGWGNGYRRFGIGFTLNSLLFGSNYWISDPYAYRLPPAYGPYRWVRYYNDALLVDVRTGYVVDTVYDIFW